MASLQSRSIHAVTGLQRYSISRLRCCLHSSANCQNQKARGNSRTRLAEDLKPESSKGYLEVAPRNKTAPFTREAAPHTEPGVKRLTSNFRKPRPFVERPPRYRRESSRETQSSSSRGPSSRESSYIPANEFYRPSAPVTTSSSKDKLPGSFSRRDDRLPTTFSFPPLMRGFVTSLQEVLGPNPKPTPIQALSMKWLLSNSPDWRQFLLASETGSGKSIAYLLPVLQHLKKTEVRRAARVPTSQSREGPHKPRALVLAPTHELSRQLSKFAKSLLHEVKLRVLCASRPNNPHGIEARVARNDWNTIDGFDMERGVIFPVDIVFGTPMKLIDMVRGQGWDREPVDLTGIVPDWKPRTFGITQPPEIDLQNVEWVVVDEADILFDSDFQEATRTLLSDISRARGKMDVPVLKSSSLPLYTPPGENGLEQLDPVPVTYPFNLILSTATIPSGLATYLDKAHPSMIRLASPSLHRLPTTLKTEYLAWSGGNKFADIERRLRQVWADDSSASNSPDLSKVLIFCNKSTKVIELGQYLEEQGIKNVALTSTSEARQHGSNKHLDGFLRPLSTKEKEKHATKKESSTSSSTDEPRVMITTSLLSRGLDFSPEIQHVFIVDEPRNMIDFLHRAGRSGRAGEKGKVVVFGKMSGRGSTKGKDAKKRVQELAA
ncbi:hypothetical protein AMATHDRAFT_66100 [Amanita thiersii Skay4041]|uniref:RNA helicase n=1 Tax=Amanita thiersii Skay4041 TaxID=703135 RepID=A0A2A9NDL6_9AGAR|nr:hypothetical protein AMATHDRAFT_66100 [Amanita thiersii Skay4041]